MKIATKPMTYKIACYDGARYVRGHAIALPPPLDEFRLCARYSVLERAWKIDHYDSGWSITGPTVGVLEDRPEAIAYVRKWQRDGSSKDSAIAWLIRYLTHLACEKPERIAAIRAAQGQ